MMSTQPAATITELEVGQTHLAHEAMSELRATMASHERFVERVDGELRPNGYRLVGAFRDQQEQAVAATGFRIVESLALGRFLYVDDLSTVHRARRQGLAMQLMSWLVAEGRRLGCGQLHLDSVVGPTRFDAHRFYHAFGMAIYAHHFTSEL